MRSRSNSLENSELNSIRMQDQAPERQSKCDETAISFQVFHPSCLREPPDNMSTVESSHCSQAQNTNSEGAEKIPLGDSSGLSRDDLLLLLSILEGELQARDEVITVLRAEKIDLALLEANYGFMTPPKVLQALHRDTIQGRGQGCQEDIYEKPIAELDKLVEKQKEACRHMLEQLLLVEQAHKQTLYNLEDEKRNHSEYMKKSDEFIRLLEQERERLRILNDQEKTGQEQKQKENNRKVANLKDELTKLKSFALMVIDEQEHVSEQLTQQTAKVQVLQAASLEAQEKLKSVETKAEKMESKVMHLESELHDQTVQFNQQKEALSTKLTEENSQNRHLHQKLSTLCQELEESKKALSRAEEELQNLKDKNTIGESEKSSLVLKMEEFRKKVVEIEGKDEELVKVGNLSRDLMGKLERESIQHHTLKAEVEKLNHRIMEFEKLEDFFGKNKQESSSLKFNIENEMTVTKHMANDLDDLKVRMKEIKSAADLLEKSEWTLKEDLTKLKTLTVLLINERKTMAEKLKQLENKVQNSTDKLQAEQDKVTLVTEKLTEERKNALKIKVEMEEKICVITKERDDLKTKLKTEEEKNNTLQSKLGMMKKRLQSLEAIERQFLGIKTKQENIKGSIQNGFQDEDNKIKDLTQEVEWLRTKIRELTVVDGLPKRHNEGNPLENKYTNEKALTEEAETTRKELSKYQLDEKENINQELVLYKQLKEEKLKSSHLTKEVEVLKEKMNNYMGMEESLCKLKTEYATLQRKLTKQELKNKELAKERETFTRELERYRHFSKSLRPGMIGRRLSDLQVSTKEVQTEKTDSPTPTYKNLLAQVVGNGKESEERNQQHEPNFCEMNPAKCSHSLKTSHSPQNKTKIFKSMRKQQHINCKMQTTQDETPTLQGNVSVTDNASKPYFKVTLDHSQTTTLENTTATTDNPRSSLITAVIPTSGCPTKQHFTIVPTVPVSQTTSTLGITTHSQTVIPEITSLSTTNSAISPTEATAIITGVSDREQETEVKESQTVFLVIPQRENNLHGQASNSINPSDITHEDNKIRNHLGIPYLQTMKSNPEPSSSCCSHGFKIKSTSTPILQPSKTAEQMDDDYKFSACHIRLTHRSSGKTDGGLQEL